MHFFCVALICVLAIVSASPVSGRPAGSLEEGTPAELFIEEREAEQEEQEERAAEPAPSPLGRKVSIHGFGGWSVGDTDGNRYLGGTEGRGYDSRSFALNVIAEPSPKLRVGFQGFYGPPIDNPETIEADIDYGFGEWMVSDRLRFRGGISKTPFGVYTEIFDVGTVRPFFDLPQGLYGPSEVVAKSYFGIGFTGRVGRTSAWAMQYDVYGGEIEIDSAVAGNPLLFAAEERHEERVAGRLAARGGEGEEGEEGGEQRTKLIDMLGARINLYAPIDGLSFGISAFSGDPEFEGEPAGPIPSHDVFGAHVAYETLRLEVRAEYASRDGGLLDMEVDASYVEVAYRLDDHWQIAVRFDEADIEPNRPERVPAQSLLEHEDLAVGVNYWLSGNFVLKLSYHDVEGNLFAIPGRNPAVLEKKPLDPETSLLQFGVQFSF